MFRTKEWGEGSPGTSVKWGVFPETTGGKDFEVEVSERPKITTN